MGYDLSMEELEVDLDVIDVALEKLLDEFISDDASEEEFDSLANIFMDLYADMVDDGDIPEAPPEDSDEQLKKEWVESAIPVLREHLQGEVDGNSSME